MRFLKKWKIKHSGFSSITVFQPAILQERLVFVQRKPSTILQNIQRIHHQHLNTNYHVKLSLFKQETLPITLMCISKSIVGQPLKKKFILQRTLFSKYNLQDISDHLLANSIRKEKEFYKYHPTLAAKLANELFANSSIYKGMKNNRKPITQPAFFQLLPKQVLHQIPLQQKLQPTGQSKKEERVIETKEELHIMELHQIIQEVYEQIENLQQRNKRRKGRL